MKFKLLVLAFVAFFISPELVAQKKVIDQSAYQEWKRVENYNISQDGGFVTYRYRYIDNSDKNSEIEKRYYLFDYVSKKNIVLDSISNPNFYANGQWLMYEKNEKSTLMRLKDKRSFEWTKEGAPNFIEDGQLVWYYVNEGKDFVICDLSSGDTTFFASANCVNFYNNIGAFVFLKETPKSIDICYYKVGKKGKQRVFFSDTTKTLKTFFANKESNKGYFQIVSKNEERGSFELLYNFDLNSLEVEEVLDKNSIAVGASLYIDRGSFSTYTDGKYITFNVYPKKTSARKKSYKNERDSTFELELWRWNDSVSQSVQASKGFRGDKVKPQVHVYNRETKKHYMVIKEPYSSIFYSVDKDCDYAVVSDNFPYSKSQDWEYEKRYDLYLVNLQNGDKRVIKKGTTFAAQWSLNGDYILYYDSDAKAWFSLEPKSFSCVNISDAIGYPVSLESYDKPNPTPSYGLTGWTRDGKNALINDKYDIWVVDLAGENLPYSYTSEYGRKNNSLVRLVNARDISMVVDLKSSYDVEIRQWKTMDMAIGTLYPSGKIEKKVEGPFSYQVLKVSNNGSTYLYQRQNYNTDRDIWISDVSFKKPYKISNANPQHHNYKWGSVEIVEWTNYSGKLNRGLLFLPEGYKKGESYPAIVNFYETHTQGKHTYYAPAYSSAMLDVPTFTSNGYIVFMPDVKFTIGEPGKSSYSAVVSGTKALIDVGILDSNRIGLQGHSWSGYLAAYLVTRTAVFKCANIGAPVTNMTSAFTGIREESGAPRMFMYEEWQSRMGATLWQSLDKYIEASPILFADKIVTPMLIFHNEDDGAVPFYEGRNIFLALRRLQKPAWLLNYKGEGHFVSSLAAKKDWTVRMKQFFDHYLNDAPMPRWMLEGINVNERGYDQKLDVIKQQ